MSSLIVSKSRNANSPLASQLGSNNVQKYQQGYQLQLRESGTTNASPTKHIRNIRNNRNIKNKIDLLYDQSEESSSNQVGSSSIISQNQRISQLSNHETQNTDLLAKQRFNQSPWRRNLTNKSNALVSNSDSKNGYSTQNKNNNNNNNNSNNNINNNEGSTLVSQSAQKQQSNQISMSPPPLYKIKNMSSEQQRANMNSSYFLHFDQPQLQSQTENNQSISSKNPSHRHQSNQHRMNNFSQNSPNTQPNATGLNANIIDVSPNIVSNTTKSTIRKNYMHHSRKTTGINDTLGAVKSIGVVQNTALENIGVIDNIGDTPLNQQQKQKKHPLTARASAEMSSYQKKMRLHSLNMNIHRIFKEDKFQYTNHQLHSDSTAKSNKDIGLANHSTNRRSSQQNMSVQEQLLTKYYQNPQDITQTDTNEKTDRMDRMEVIPTNKVESNNKSQSLRESQRGQEINPMLNSKIKNSDLKEKRENDSQIKNVETTSDNDTDEIAGNAYFVDPQTNPTFQQKILSYTEDPLQSAGQSSLELRNKRNHKNMNVLYTEPQNESRRSQSKSKNKSNVNRSHNEDILNNLQNSLNNQQNNQSNYSRGLALSNSPRANYRQRSNTQASTLAIPPKINLSLINPNQLSPQPSLHESPLFSLAADKQNNSQEEVQAYKMGTNTNHLYFLKNSPLLRSKITNQQTSGAFSGKSGMNCAMKNYINNSQMIKQSYLNLQQQQSKQCRTQVDSSISLTNHHLNNNNNINNMNIQSPFLLKSTDKDMTSIQLLSLNQCDSIHQQKGLQNKNSNFQFSSIDEKNTMRDTLTKLKGNMCDRSPITTSVPLKDIQYESNKVQQNDQSSSKNKSTKQSVKNYKRQQSLNQSQQRTQENGENTLSRIYGNEDKIKGRVYENGENIHNRANSGNKYVNNCNKLIHPNQDKRQQRIKVRNKVYSTNSSNQSLNASIDEKYQLYVDKYKTNLQNDLSLIQKMNKQKQIRENDLYNVQSYQGQPSYIDKKLDYASEIDLKIHYLSHQKIQPSDLKSNHLKQQNQQYNYSPRVNQQSQNNHYQYQNPSSQCSFIQNNPYSPENSRRNTQLNDYKNIHTSLSQNSQIEIPTNTDNPQTDNLIQCLSSNQKHDASTSANSSRDNDNSSYNHIWRKLTYSKEKGKINHSSLEEELQKVDFLSKNNEKALNQYVQIKENALQISQFMESQIQIRKTRNNSQEDL